MSVHSHTSFGIGLAFGCLLTRIFNHGAQVVPHRQRRGRWKLGRGAPLPNAGDLANESTLTKALAVRSSVTGEIIFMLTDQHHMRLAINLLLNLNEHSLLHHLVLASSSVVCASLWARAEPINVSLGCGHSSFLQRGSGSRVNGGLDAYSIDDFHVYHLWVRIFTASNAHARAPSLLSSACTNSAPFPSACSGNAGIFCRRQSALATACYPSTQTSRFVLTHIRS